MYIIYNIGYRECFNYGNSIFFYQDMQTIIIMSTPMIPAKFTPFTQWRRPAPTPLSPFKCILLELIY